MGLSANEPAWHPTVFTKNRDRLLEGVVAEEFFSLVVQQARQKRLLSDDHFTVDGTLIEAWAGQKSFQTKKDAKTLQLPPPQDRGSNPTVNLQRKTRFRGPDRVGWMFTCAAAAYNLVRMRHLLAQPA